MRELPAGTVTFLFTDVEGSTRLLYELGDGYAEVLAEHRRVLRDAFTRYGGVEVDTQGDAFFVAFARASDALAAARAGQDALAAGPMSVRMGLHTGEPQVTESDYAGIDVHRAARIAAAGHGGQILVSQSTRDLGGSDGLRDLGEHRLKDLAAPERIYQLGDGEFPPLKSLNTTNLPLPVEPLIDRKKELADVLGLIRRDGVRLVTVTGPGGVGKTRFALAVAAELVEDYAHGVWFVNVAAVREPDLVASTIAGRLGARGELTEHIGDREMVILLDNVEQVVSAASDLAALVSDCPHLVLLVTSREPLQIAGERRYPVGPLPESPAVELFRQRASATDPTFEGRYHELAALCDRLDRLPLAIELAAARVGLLTVEAIAERVDQRLDLLKSRRRDLPERQQTLRATIQWSYELLSEEEQRLFTDLAVFVGSFDVLAAEAVAAADIETLQSLVDKNLLRRAADGRFFMLVTVREFALERLGSGRAAAEIRRRHALHFLSLSERLDMESRAHDPTGSYYAIDLEIGNLRAAIEWTRESNHADLLLRLATALWRFWSVRGYVAEGRAVLEQALATTEDRPAQALLGLCTLRLLSGASAADLMSDTDAALVACELDGDDFSRAQAWNLVGKLNGSLLAQLGKAERAFEQALVYSERGNYHTERAESIWGLTSTALFGPLPVPAAIARSEELLRLIADEPETRAFCQCARGALEAMAGQFDVARDLLAEGTSTFEQLGLNVWAANNAQLSFVIEMLAGEPEVAARALRTSFNKLEEMGEQGFLSTIAGYLAHALYTIGDYVEAERFSRASELAAPADDVLSQILWRTARAKILARWGKSDRAEKLASDAVDLAEQTDLLNTRGDALLDLTEVLVLAGRRAEGRAKVEEAAILFARKGNAVSLERARELSAALMTPID